MASIENVLLKSEEKIRAFFNGIPMPTYVWQFIDENLILLDFNRAAEEFLQGNMASYLGIKANDLYKDRLDIVEDLYTCLKEKKSIFRELDNAYQAIDEFRYLSVKYGFIPPDLVLVHTEDITEKKELEEKLKKSDHEQKERIKELLCLYGISDLAIKANITTDELIQGALKLIPPSMQFPEIICAEIKYKEQIYRTTNFKETSWNLSTSITVVGNSLEIYVYYLEENIFTAEETHLLNDIVNRLEMIIAKKDAEEKLKKLNLELEKKIEERTKELKESEEKFRTAVENSPNFILFISRDGIILEVNRLEKGFTREMVIGQSIFNEYFYETKDQCESVRNSISNSLESGEITQYEHSQITPEGSLVFYETKVSPFEHDDENRIISFQLTTREITVRKIAEQKDMRKTNIMKAINEVFKKALTCESEEELGKTCLEVAQELSGAKFGYFGEVNSEGSFDTLAISNPGWDECAMPESTATRLIKGMEIRGMQFLPLADGKSRIFNNPSNHPDSIGTPEGHPIIISLLAVPFIYKDEIIGQIGLGNKEGGFTRDDLEAIETLSIAMIEALLRKRAEDNLKKSEENYRKSYKRENFYKDLFAHDINNILNGIKGASELYLLYEKDSTKLREKHTMINIIKDQVIKGALLVSNVQKLSQLEEGKDIILKEINVREIMNKAKKYIQESFQERTINIDEYYFIKKPIVLADELLLDVFDNLLNNSVKYNDSPTVKIQIRISRKTEIGKNYIKVELIDNGIGVMNTRKKIIFKKGFKREKGTKGMGFGLTLVNKLIKTYNGKIWVENNVEGDYTQGSNFIILIPESI